MAVRGWNVCVPVVEADNHGEAEVAL